MATSHITLILFGLFSSLRIISYLPQIYKVATDNNGASAIAYSTWMLWIGANVTTALYAATNLHDRYLAVVSSLYAVCCVIVVALTALKRRMYRRRKRQQTARPVNRATEMAIKAPLLADEMRAQTNINIGPRQSASAST
jgi:hypothetical protein